MNNLYNKYANTISNALKNGKRRGQLEKSFSESYERSFANEKQLVFSNQAADEAFFQSLQPLSAIAGKVAKYNERPGAHPQFVNIKEGNTTESHYITSMFIDISNSTDLFKKYEPITVANITTTIQRAAMHTMWYFDGFVQRFHGDGTFIYFGGRNMTLAQSVQNAINAGSFFSYFVKNDLKALFLEQGIERIFTRIGIDVGEDAEVLWHLAGMGDCSEITTCSLHTSLAAHLQGNASRNGIMVGDNIKKKTLLSPELFSINKSPDGKEDRYIFEIPDENFYYTQWAFNWEKYLKTHPLFMPEKGRQPEKNLDFLKSQVSGYKPYYHG